MGLQSGAFSVCGAAKCDGIWWGSLCADDKSAIDKNVQLSDSDFNVSFAKVGKASVQANRPRTL